MKINEMGEKFWDIFSDVHTIISILMGNRSPTGSTDSSSGGSNRIGEKADPKGKGQMDERLAMTAFARAIDRLIRKQDIKHQPIDRKRAMDMVEKVIGVINSYDPIQRRQIILTIGLEQTVKSKKIPQGKDKNGKDKLPIIEEVVQNIDGQDIIIMLALSEDESFIRQFCDAITASGGITSYRWNQVEEKLKEINDGMETFFEENTPKTCHPVLDAIPIVNLFFRRK